MRKLRRLGTLLREGLLDLFTDDEEDDREPFFDPVHLGAVCIVCLTVVGALYWLLWTLLVYEGGLFIKLRAALAVLLTERSLRDFGYEGTPYAQGAFEGWLGNLTALALSVLVLWALLHLYRTAARGGARASRKADA
ncbi:MAG: hypothetical protein HY926_07360 [Elusimicrobia bacterium]|nr:hypothetical protein [Elusimicrobiota bacterium]